MKKNLLTLALSIFMLTSFSQSSIDFEIDFDTLKVNKYRAFRTASKIVVRMRFSDNRILHPEVLTELKDKKISQVEMVYSNYPKDFNSEMLNITRLAELQKLAPAIFEDKSIKWKLIEQTGCNSKNVYNFFHGFVITLQDEALVNTEYIAGDKTYVEEDQEKEYYEDTYEKTSIEKVLSGQEIVEDSVVLKTLSRHRWKDMVVVSDFTGSMSPYISEILLWHKLNTDLNKSRIERFVFFNDGDSKEDDEKGIGRTGGIYYTSKIDMEHIIDVAVKTISLGSGGDEQENDIEALLFAQEQNPHAENFVLIADNSADMRDIQLIKFLKKPVKIILCGVEDYINTQYLDLALATKGSIHTIEEDIDNLYKIRSSGSISIGGNLYYIKNGKFTHD